MQTIKLVIVGDGGVGKTSLLATYASGNFPTGTTYIPSSYDRVMVNGGRTQLLLWDTAGQDDYDRLRPLVYPQTDLFLVAFSIASAESLERVRSKWLPEVLFHVPTASVIIVGTKTDLREDADTVDRLAADCLAPITPEQGKEVALEFNVDYMECSARSKTGLNDIFDEAVRLVLAKQPNQPTQQRCTLL